MNAPDPLAFPLHLVNGTRTSYLRAQTAHGSRYVASSIGDDAEAIADLTTLRDAANTGAAAAEVARVLDAVSLWLTGEGRYLAQRADTTEPKMAAVADMVVYQPDLEALICDVEGLRATLGRAD